ncbi:hypothetical protein PAXRUDRAFT_668586 [Paxillus rubicundulus Ve08.2h10]|uniref:Uncharacterized protein n=1 Tax=Paxillus rubicundulus Ve08.2h10 TaxID=930991 RepID=A0A0D0D2G8_9AGAM|nr:hypothetical protein PAXRUDRAFT_668586 [Paxillus rubicundulus Ve08.2h10]
MSSPRSTPQPSPQRKSTFRSRVGGVMRRSSTAFTIPGLPNRSTSATPPPPQDSDTASVSGDLSREGSTSSLNKIDTAPVTVAASTTPSPIPESPAREAAALAAEPAAATSKGPSPLANMTTAEAASEQSPIPVQGTPPPPEPAAITAAPQPTISADEQPAQTVPAVVIDEAQSPKPEVALLPTPEPEEMPTAQVVPRSAPSSAPASRASTPPPHPSAPRSVAPSISPSVSRSAAPSAPVTPAAQLTSATSYFGDIPRSTTPLGLESDPDTNVWADQGPRAGTTSSESSSDVAPGRVVTNKPSKSSIRQRGSSVGSSQVMSTQPQSRIASRKPSGVLQARQTELAGTTYTWSNSSEMGLGSKTSLPLVLAQALLI